MRMTARRLLRFAIVLCGKIIESEVRPLKKAVMLLGPKSDTHYIEGIDQNFD